MIPTAMRAARMSGIALCMKRSFVGKSSNAIFDAELLEKFRRGQLQSFAQSHVQSTRHLPTELLRATIAQPFTVTLTARAILYAPVRMCLTLPANASGNSLALNATLAQNCPNSECTCRRF